MKSYIKFLLIYIAILFTPVLLISLGTILSLFYKLVNPTVINLLYAVSLIISVLFALTNTKLIKIDGKKDYIARMVTVFVSLIVILYNVLLVMFATAGGAPTNISKCTNFEAYYMAGVAGVSSDKIYFAENSFGLLYNLTPEGLRYDSEQGKYTISGYQSSEVDAQRFFSENPKFLECTGK